ncbi:hypothetical protein K438DRAFT_2013431, partial [Mycena galopus ATCC 62051]
MNSGTTTKRQTAKTQYCPRKTLNAAAARRNAHSTGGGNPGAVEYQFEYQPGLPPHLTCQHELTDPMRGASTVPIPGSHPELPGAASTSNSAYTPHTNTSGWSAYGGGVQTPGWDVMTPGGTRRSRLSGFWSR